MWSSGVFINVQTIVEVHLLPGEEFLGGMFEFPANEWMLEVTRKQNLWHSDTDTAVCVTNNDTLSFPLL
jgi:hypothetical protein